MGLSGTSGSRTLRLALWAAAIAVMGVACGDDDGTTMAGSGGAGGEQTAAGGAANGGDDTGGNDVGGAGGSGGVGGTTGIGGAGGTTNGGAGGAPNACGVDCSEVVVAPACEEAFCDESTGFCALRPVTDGATCDDGLFCTVSDSCLAGSCQGAANDCGLPSSPCETVSCDEATQMCSSNSIADGTTCASSDLCLSNTTCQSGQCLGDQNDCSMGPPVDDCNVAVCNPGTGVCDLTAANDGQPCASSDLCLVNTLCSAGVCQGGSPTDCSAASGECEVGVCDASNGQCVPQPAPMGQACASATNDCNAGTCDAAGTCLATPANEGGTCDDANACTSSTTCTAGVCGGGTNAQTIYFTETFANNTAGWTLGPEWQIGAATASPSPGSCGAGDPGQDHTPTVDNGIAGVVIGGNAATNPTHGYYYLTSPAIDTSTIPGPLVVEYWRFLNSDYTPFMANRVEVYDGTAWVTLFQSGGSPGVRDSTWAAVSHDITPYKNVLMQVRFGFELTSSGAFTCSQWNLDDVVVANIACN